MENHRKTIGKSWQNLGNHRKMVVDWYLLELRNQRHPSWLPLQCPVVQVSAKWSLVCTILHIPQMTGC